MKSGACDAVSCMTPTLHTFPHSVILSAVTSLGVCVCVWGGSFAPLIHRQITRPLVVMKAGTVKDTTWV